MAGTVTVELEAELVARFKAARDARRAAGEALEANDSPEAVRAFNGAQRAEDEAAAWIALSVANRAGEAA
ncbi:MAG: hypothetical protein HYV09_35820 [Deltaproteobacteria bacterium]|nr:hypothetical protein [Deltaproteobacteria bacterium]